MQVFNLALNVLEGRSIIYKYYLPIFSWKSSLVELGNQMVKCWLSLIEPQLPSVIIHFIKEIKEKN